MLAVMAPPATAVTLPAALHAFGHRSLSEAVAIGLAPVWLVLLVVAPVVAIYTIVSLVAVLVTMGRVLLPGPGPASCVDDLYRWIVNPVISLLTLTPFTPPTRRAKAASKSMPKAADPLPPAPGSALDEDDRLYWETLQSRAAQGGGARSDVPLPDDPATEPVGRHARPVPRRSPVPASAGRKPSRRWPVPVGGSPNPGTRG